MGETALVVPTFYVVGNHDVDPDTFPKGTIIAYELSSHRNDD